MRILLVNEKWGMSGGQERYILQVGNGLLQRGHDVRLVFGEAEGPVVDTTLAKFRADLISSLNPEAVIKYTHDFNPDVVNLQNVYDSRLISSLSPRYPVTRFVHDHATYCPGNSKYFFNSRKICPVATSGICLLNAYREKCMTRRLLVALARVTQRREWIEVLKTLPLVLCNSSYVKDRLVQNGIDAEKVVVNGLFPGHNILDLNGFPIGLGPLGHNPQEKTILFVGRLFKEKGADLLIRAVSQLDAPLKVKIVGDGWEKEELVRLAEELKVNHKVEFLGFKNVRELAALYSQCDMFVMPSVWPEPFGMVGLEAGQFRKPVIAFNVGGISDWLEDGVNGLLLWESNVNFLSEAINKLILNPRLCREMGERGFELVKHTFNLERHLDVLEQTYQKIMK